MQSKMAPSNIAPERSAPCRFAPERSAPCRFAPLKWAPTPLPVTEDRILLLVVSRVVLMCVRRRKSHVTLHQSRTSHDLLVGGQISVGEDHIVLIVNQGPLICRGANPEMVPTVSL